MTIRGKRWAAITVALIALVALLATPYVATVAFLLDLAGIGGLARTIIPVRPRAVTTRDIDVPTRHGVMTVRVYEPAGRPAPTVVVYPGVHGGGVEAPRLVQLCHRMSASGLTVVCAPLPDLRAFRLTGRSTDMIEDATAWVAGRPEIAPDGVVTLVGVSFAGGLALVAAGRPALDGRLRAVVSIGGHGDLTRTLRYLSTGVLPDGTVRKPHDYALAVVVLTMAERLVPPDQVEGLERGVRTFLQASLDDSAEFATARRLMADLERLTPTLPEPSRALVEAAATRDVVRMGRAIAPFIDEFGNDPAMSPALAPPPHVPVFLLHGADDNVIPSSEAALTAADLAARGGTPVRWLLTPLVSHARLLDGAGPWDMARLVAFWADVRAHVH